MCRRSSTFWYVKAWERIKQEVYHLFDYWDCCRRLQYVTNALLRTMEHCTLLFESAKPRRGGTEKPFKSKRDRL
jgi:hypothetical protein